MGYVSSGKIGEYIKNNSESMLSAYGTSFSSLPTYIAMAQAVEDQTDFTLDQLTTAPVDGDIYNDISAALQKLGYSADDA